MIGSSHNEDTKEFHKYIDTTKFSKEIEEAIKGMLRVVLTNEENDINLDFEDFKIILSHGGMVFSGIGEYEGKSAAIEAVQLAIKNSSLDYSLMDKITGVLVHFVIHPDLEIINLAEAMELINENANEEAEIIFGTTTKNSVSKSCVKATVLFTGYEKNEYKNTILNNIE
ncbi:hypothetical protein JHD46_00485 [Sulfurimonas sp. SAG-AH-194-C20]|nr:hypothetical protein [Sulfurimonas sp. SAG-AH-194-C20]MDF1878108.1 hypothetical protein [Sulfurimonas sp. SAG-AH-194-C20]